MNNLRNTYLTLFFVGWFFFPFNDFRGYEFLGEFKNESGAYFFLLGFFVFVIDVVNSGKISIPYRSKVFRALSLFLVWCIVATVLNYNAVSESYFKHTGGVYRFIRQYISLMISTIVFVFYFWNVIYKWSFVEILYKIRRILLYCLIFVFVYGFLETLVVVFHFFPAKYILSVFDYFPFLDVNYPPGERISSVTYESPSLGNYLITVSAWMFSYIFTEKNKYRFVPTFMVLFLMFFSGSRTALINIGIQFMVLISVMYSMEEYKRVITKGLLYTVVISSFLLILNGEKIVKSIEDKAESLNFRKNLTTNISNQSRFGMQYASLQVFKEHPIVGVGFGQETYYKRFHYPRWATKNNFEFRLHYQNKNEKSFPTSYNIYTRLLAETGIVGFGLFLYFILMCFFKSKKIWKEAKEERKILGFILMISFLGFILNWLQTDFFRQYGFWLCMVILIKLINESPAQKTTTKLN
ncbi:MAG: O-antigen ligase family protein [Bacteroidetes bacterium]|nr:O-antigen ligase family protein [Bacteroidota bacterium]